MEKTINKQLDGAGDSIHTFGDVFSSTKETLEPKLRKALSDSAGQVSDFATEAKRQMSAKGKEAYAAIDRNARAQPWRYIAGATALGMAVSYYVMSRKK